jgi:hypothetical protein
MMQLQARPAPDAAGGQSSGSAGVGPDAAGPAPRRRARCGGARLRDIGVGARCGGAFLPQERSLRRPRQKRSGGGRFCRSGTNLPRHAAGTPKLAAGRLWGFARCLRARRVEATSSFAASSPCRTPRWRISSWTGCSTSCCCGSARRSAPTRPRSCCWTRRRTSSSRARPTGSRRRSRPGRGSPWARASRGRSPPSAGRSRSPTSTTATCSTRFSASAASNRSSGRRSSCAGR